MKIYILTLIAATALLASCSQTEPANQTPNAANVAAQNDQSAAETKPAEPTRSPTDTLKALNEASKKKDPAAIQSYLSAGTLEILKQSAAAQNKSVDELLKEDEAAPFHDLPRILGEKIEGDTAIVEVENKVEKTTEKIPFIKENGEWKVAIDVYLKNLEAEFEKENRQPASNK